MTFTFLDVVLVAVFLLGIFAGAGQGMVRQVFSLLGLFFGITLASQRYQELAGQLTLLGSPDVAKLASFVLIVVAALIAASLVGSVVHRALGLMALGCIDWLGGGVIGAVETLFFVDTALILALKYPVLGLPEAIRDSKIPHEVLKLAPAVLALLPPEFDAVRKLLEQ